MKHDYREVRRRPERDSWSRLGVSEPPNGIPPGGFMDYPVGEVVTGVSVAVASLASGQETGEYVRGIAVETGTWDLVFDKGGENRGDVWRVRECPSGELSFDTAAFDPDEDYGLRAETRIERIC